MDTVFESYTQGEELHIVQYTIEKDSEHREEIGRISMDADEYFEIYHQLISDKERKFDTAAQYAMFLMNLNGLITLQSARALWRIATHQIDNFLILKGNYHEQFRVLDTADPQEHSRLEKSFKENVVATCHRRKLQILRRGFK